MYKTAGTSPEVLSLIINHAYTRIVPLMTGRGEGLLITADKLRAMGIIRLCCEF